MDKNEKESATDVESTTSNTPTGTTASKAQNSVFGSAAFAPKTDKVSTTNATFTPSLGNPFKKLGDGSPEPANKSSKFGFRSSTMKPSSFSSMCAKPQTNSFKLKPSVLSNSLATNPFKKSKLNDESDEDFSSTDKSKTKNEEEKKEPEENSNAVAAVEPHTSPKESEPNDQSSLFVPLSSQSESMKSSDDSLKSNGISTSNTQSTFIFGQNLQPKNKDEKKGGGYFATDSQSSDNKTENLFKSFLVLPSDKKTQDDWTSGKSLVETSRELTEREQNLKRKYDEVEIVTGEEEESNVIQMICKLYSWTAGSWQERGRGILRLNDKAVNSEMFSRLVVRTQGTLAIMLNTKVWADMSVEKVNDKSVRFTACDADGQPKLFLVMGAPKDVETLHTSLDYRIFESKRQQKIIKSSEEEKP